MTDTQNFVYWVGIIVLSSGGIVGVLFIVALAMDIAWKKAQDIYTFPVLIKAIRSIQAGKEQP